MHWFDGIMTRNEGETVRERRHRAAGAAAAEV